MEFVSSSHASPQEAFKASRLHNSIKNMPGRGGASIVQVIFFSFLFSFLFIKFIIIIASFLGW